MDSMADSARRLGYEFLLSQTVDGRPFPEAYTEAGITFTIGDVEFVREESGEIHIGFWLGNSNLYWSVSLQEWAKHVRWLGPHE